jgi:hypothetical protein
MQAERALAIVAVFGVVACGDHKDAPADASVNTIDAAIDAPIDAAKLPPSIVSITPAGGSDDVALDAVIDIEFSEPIDPASVTASSIVVDMSGTPLAGTRVVTGAHVVFAPTSPFAIATIYNVTVTTAITDLDAHALVAPGNYSFRTLHHRRVFLTSVSGFGNLAAWPDAAGQVGLAAADAICQSRANAVSLGGTYIAWLSSSTSDAYCRVQKLSGQRATNCGQATLPSAAGPWLRVDGAPWAGTLAELTGASPRVYTPQLLTEYGTPAPYGQYYSNTTATGVANGTSCSDWSSSTGGVGYGGNRMSGTYWTDWQGTWPCSVSSELLCLEVGSGPPLPAFPAITGKRAFVTSTLTTGNLATSPDAGGQTGVTAGDAICQARAQAASLPNPNRFKAWLSTQATSAASRITSDGPWQRVDGMPIANSKLDLLDTRLATSLNVTETGAYLTGALAWTSTWRDGTALTLTCGDWTGSATTAYVGRANDPWRWSYAEYVASCTTTSARLYCFED